MNKSLEIILIRPWLTDKEIKIEVDITLHKKPFPYLLLLLQQVKYIAS